MLSGFSSHAILGPARFSTVSPSGVTSFRYAETEIPIPPASACEKILLRMEQNLGRAMSDGEILRFLSVLLARTGETLDQAKQVCLPALATFKSVSGDKMVTYLANGVCLFETWNGVERRFLVSELVTFSRGLGLMRYCFVKVPFPIDPSLPNDHGCPR